MPEAQSPNGPLLVTFLAGDIGDWATRGVVAVQGASLGVTPRVRVSTTAGPHPVPDGGWALRGVVSNMRYTTGSEARALSARQEPLARAHATRAALIPIRKSALWWSLPQDERRAIYEERSKHTTVGMEYLPRIARRLHHSRDLGEPFDFLTWFEFAPEHEADFDHMLTRMRASEEWRYVEREVDIRLERAA